MDLAAAVNELGAAIELQGFDPRHHPPADLLMAHPLRRRFPQGVLIQADPAPHLVQAAEDELHRRVRPLPPGGVLQLHALDELADQGLHDPESFLELDEVDLRPVPGS